MGQMWVWAMATLLLAEVYGARPVAAAPAKFSMSLNKIPLIGALDTAWEVFRTDLGTLKKPS